MSHIFQFYGSQTPSSRFCPAGGLKSKERFYGAMIVEVFFGKFAMKGIPDYSQIRLLLLICLVTKYSLPRGLGVPYTILLAIHSVHVPPSIYIGGLFLSILRIRLRNLVMTETSR